jgi:two-component system nitrogen regulation sensor histidine kinase NtrY
MGLFDRRLITQAVTNLVKNATESVEACGEAGIKKDPSWKPKVEVSLSVSAGTANIDVIDNGVGLPKQNRSRLLEPYVTTKGSKGTGLGLAIVQKITEQHGGVLTLEDAPSSDPKGADAPQAGALVRISIPLRPAAQPEPVKADDRPSRDLAAPAAE